MHPILRELHARDLSQAWLARESGLSAPYIGDIVLRRAGCSGRAALLLERALGGAVTVKQILEANPTKDELARRRAGRARKRAFRRGRTARASA